MPRIEAPANDLEGATFRARNSYVILRQVRLGRFGGLAMPDEAAQGMKFVVTSVGPKVEDLAEGDEVMIMGGRNENYFEVIGTRDLLIIDERLVPYVVTRKAVVH